MGVILTFKGLKKDVFVNRLLFTVVVMLGLLFGAGCAFYPTTSDQQHHSDDCQMYTRELALDYAEMPIEECAGSGAEGSLICLAALGVVVPVGSLVASGSIVVAGNSLHWLEYHGTCNEGLLWSAIEDATPDE